MRKKVLLFIGVIVIAIILSTGIITSLLISNDKPSICDQEREFPYQYKHSQPYNETEISVFPHIFLYTNQEIFWIFNSTTPLILIVMNDENYYEYEKFAFHRENGKIIANDGQFLPYVEYYMLNNSPSLYGTGYWKAPYLDWWCFTIVNSMLKPVDRVREIGYGCAT